MSDDHAPRRLPFNPSLNRVVLADLPGAPAGIPGTRANSWLTTWGVARGMATTPDIAAGVRSLGIPLPDLPPDAASPADLAFAAPWPAALDRLLADPAHGGHDAAVAYADRLGAVLGLLVATVTLGPQDARAARPEWPDSQWRRWAAARTIALGGGLLRGALGQRLFAGARGFLVALGAPVHVELVPEPAELVMRGTAARIEHGVAVDAGGTSIKRLLVHPHATPERAPDIEPPRSSDPHDVARHLAGAIVPLVQRLTPHEIPGAALVSVSLSLATYVDPTGRPYADQLGHYAPLAYLDTPRVLARLVQEHARHRVALVVQHDGAAALAGARTSAPAVDAAIVLGTALGSGLDSSSA